MILSYFIHNNELHLASEEKSCKIMDLQHGKLSDIAILAIQDFVDSDNLEKVIYQIGPGSFTSMRIVNAIAKGLLLSDSRVEFIGISSFLTLKKVQKSEKVFIPTMRGDYFQASFENDRIATVTIVDGAPALVERNYNLADLQIDIYKSRAYNFDNIHMTKGIHLDYGFTPEYTTKTS